MGVKLVFPNPLLMILAYVCCDCRNLAKNTKRTTITIEETYFLDSACVGFVGSQTS